MEKTPPPRSPLRIATRGSQLALWQANYVRALLESRGAATELVTIKTTGDKVQDRFLHEIGGKGLFIKELEEALDRGEADLAIHSLKDVTARLAPRFTLAAVLERHAASDLFIVRKDKAGGLGAALGPDEARRLGALRVGTGSLRRQSALKRLAPALATVGIRGNVDTRLKKLAAGEWDAIILAEASIERLRIDLGALGLHGARMDLATFVPCAAQGALAIETRADDPVTAWLAPLGSPDTTTAVGIERAVLAGLGGDCTMPFGCHARIDSARDAWVVQAVVYDKDGNEATALHEAPRQGFDAKAATRAVEAELKARGAGKILQALGIEVPPFYA